MPLSISKNIKKMKTNPNKNHRPTHNFLSSAIKKIKRDGFESWSGNGGHLQRYKEIYVDKLRNRPLKFILKTHKKKNPNIIIIGAGKGQDLFYLKKEFSDFGVSTNIDVLSLSKSLDRGLLEQNIIRKDFSPLPKNAKTLEKYNLLKDRRILNQITGKYQLLINEKGSGAFTDYPHFALFQSGLFLAKKGRAFVEIEIKRDLETTLKITNRLFTAYNKKHNLDLKFKLEILKDTFEQFPSTKTIVIQIDRSN